MPKTETLKKSTGTRKANARRWAPPAATKAAQARPKPSQRVLPAGLVRFFSAVSKAAHEKKKDPIRRAVELRARRDLAQRDYVRAVSDAAQSGMLQVQIAERLNVAQPTVSETLKRAEKRKDLVIPEGFSGASPYEIAERYAAAEITRTEMIRQLTRWPYVANDGLIAAQREWESTPYPDTAGGLEEIGRAFDDGLIDADAHDTILREIG